MVGQSHLMASFAVSSVTEHAADIIDEGLPVCSCQNRNTHNPKIQFGADSGRKY